MANLSQIRRELTRSIFFRELRGFGALDSAPNQLFTQLAQRRSGESVASANPRRAEERA